MTKIISISDDAYNNLKALKSEEESFSDVIKQLTTETKRKKLLELAGEWENDTEVDKIFKKIISERQKTKARKADF